MTPENEFIKPVENLSNVGSLTPIDKHTQKRRKQQQHDSSAGRQETPDNTNIEEAQPHINRIESGSVDYRA